MGKITLYAIIGVVALVVAALLLVIVSLVGAVF